MNDIKLHLLSQRNRQTDTTTMLVWSSHVKKTVYGDFYRRLSFPLSLNFDVVLPAYVKITLTSSDSAVWQEMRILMHFFVTGLRRIDRCANDLCWRNYDSRTPRPLSWSEQTPAVLPSISESCVSLCPGSAALALFSSRTFTAAVATVGVGSKHH